MRNYTPYQVQRIEAGRGSLNPYRITNRRPWGSVTKKTAKFKGGISGEFLRRRYNHAQRFCKV